MGYSGDVVRVGEFQANVMRSSHARYEKDLTVAIIRVIVIVIDEVRTSIESDAVF